MNPTDYQATLDYLYSVLPMYQRIGAAALKNDLTNTIALCEALGNPQNKFKSVHIAGTNGKGSSSHMLAAILQSAGYRTGLYTSPHLKEFTERIKIDGMDVTREFVVDFVRRLKPAMEKIQPSFFEMTVVMAFDYFVRNRVDIAVIEVGLGGRLDSTNVITPVTSLITNISYDHMDLLGDTLPKIALEKAGIIKQGIPVVISERQAEVEQVFIAKAKEMNAEISFATNHLTVQSADKGFKVLYDNQMWLKNINPQLKGDYQKRNLPGILMGVKSLNQHGFVISDDAVREGIEKTITITGLKGRWQKLRDVPLTICDTGHNEAGIREVIAQVKVTPHEHLHVVFGVVKEKDLSKILNLLPKDAFYYFCEAKIPRALEARILADAAAKAGLQGVVIPDVNEAIREATRRAGSNDLIFIGGSTFVVAEVMDL